MEATIQLSDQRRVALTVVVMGATLMQVLDATIANVALPHMQASLGAAPDTISWVLTSYIIAAAVATPVTGWLEARIGRRALMLGSLIGFTIASILCGLSTSLTMMVGSRLLQGLCGAFISPLGQAIMLDIYPPEHRAKALSIWGMGIMVGPILGPIIGGILTDAYNWRWVFFINVPVGIFAVFGMMAMLPKTKLKSVPFDMTGFAYLALALGSMQLVLDRGSQQDWFNSLEILIEAGISISFFWMFAVHTATSPNSIVPRALFQDRNFVLANIFLLGVMGVTMSAAALLPPMLQGLYGYDTTDAGLLIVPRGAAMVVSIFLVGRLASKIDARLMIGTGMVLAGIAQWEMTGFSPDMDRWPVIYTGLVQGLGIGLVIMPLNLLAFATISSELRTSAAAVWNLCRNIGGSIAIAIFSAIYAHNIQVNHSDITGNLSAIRYPILEAGLMEKLGAQGAALLAYVDAEVNRQAMLISYLDDFWLMSIFCFMLVPLTFLLRGSKTAPSPEMAVME
jgi:DHA2 family multidrug resistance protein